MADQVAAESLVAAVAGADHLAELILALEERRTASIAQQARLLAALGEVVALLEAHGAGDPRG